MKNLFTSAAAIILFAAATLVAKPLAITFTAENNYQGAIGVITINTPQGPGYLNVPGPGAFSTQIPTTCSDVVINGYVIFQGQSARAKALDGRYISVKWAATNVIVIDPLENN